MTPERRKYLVTLSTFLSAIMLLVAADLFLTEIVFLNRMTSYSAPIVAVAHEYVPRGEGPVLAYVPTVEVRDVQGRALRLKVDTFNEAPVYAVGREMRVRCSPELGCIEDKFFSKWGWALIDLAIALVLLAPLAASKLGLLSPRVKSLD